MSRLGCASALFLLVVPVVLIAPGINALLTSTGEGLMLALLLVGIGVMVALVCAAGPLMHARREPPVVVQHIYLVQPEPPRHEQRAIVPPVDWSGYVDADWRTVEEERAA